MRAHSPDFTAERERFVEDLLTYMSLEDRLGQLVVMPQAPDPTIPGSERNDSLFFDNLRRGEISGVGGVASKSHADALQRIAIEETRLGIPLLFAGETGTGFETIMPTREAAAASWDSAAIESAEHAVAAEAREAGINWALAPRIDLSVRRDGGVSGTSAYLAQLGALARIRGLQGGGEEFEHTLLACLTLASATAGELLGALHGPRNSSGAELAVLRGVLREEHVASIAIDIDQRAMAGDAYHAGVSVEPLARLGSYPGIVLSEWAEFARLCGLHSTQPPFCGLSVDRLVAAIDAGRIEKRRIDIAVRAVLRAKLSLGLFRADFRPHQYAAENSVITKRRHRAAALDLARKSIVLLRNNPALLPLSVDSGELLVVGTCAGDRQLPLGDQEGTSASLIDGLEQRGIAFKYVPGLALRHDGSQARHMLEADRMAIGMAAGAARTAKTVLLVLGETKQLGEAHRLLLETLCAVTDRVALITLGSHPLDPVLDGRSLPCVLHAGQLGTMSGHAITQVLTGDFAPVGRLPHAFGKAGSPRLLPMGHGLGYGEFILSDLTLERGAHCLYASAELRNVSERAGTETVQLYACRSDGEGGPCDAELRGFVRLTLASGERERVNFEIGGAELGELGDDGKYDVAPGIYDIRVGLNAAHGHMSQVSVSPAMAEAMRTGRRFPSSGRADLRSA
ncbi:glycoside hydrolase family 3 C-terminal domain-containing protein [Qipengyuania marisflavi]|uniref:Fibronectin type III-like domain-containing protein n=1 Tax=Qipengyuania marisflavi TaxID=2486356 RepID=A0A5S3P365_9SPHN|nr:glycoside hydrolase family 3 C-terminal domain-containing protein [Qipengyuania marisflavi]TMM47286.1 hypothetical protein FEV51_09445 [Qipengyuania marisflavi]